MDKIYYIPILGIIKGMIEYKKLNKKKLEVDDYIENLESLKTGESRGLIKKMIVQMEERREAKYKIISGTLFNAMLLGILSIFFFYLAFK